jgi:hypothetical protein
MVLARWVEVSNPAGDLIPTGQALTVADSPWWSDQSKAVGDQGAGPLTPGPNGTNLRGGL